MVHSAARETFVPIAPFQLPATMAQQLLGHFDPTGRRSAVAFRKVHLDHAGRPLTWTFRVAHGGFRVRVAGPEAASALEGFLAQFPLADGCDAFTPRHPLLHRLARACAGLRLLRVPWAFDVAAGAVLQQRVRWQIAYTDFRKVALRFGTHTPAGAAFPSPRQLAAVSCASLQALGIDSKRARALAGLARLEASRPFLHTEPDASRLRLRLTRIPGIGPWTANMIAGYAAGDPDAVPTGDLHIPSLVTSSLADEPEGTDERMLELLAPYAGHRFRVIRMLSWGARGARAAPGVVAAHP